MRDANSILCTACANNRLNIESIIMHVQKRCTRHSSIHIIYTLYYLYNSTIIAMDTEGLLLLVLLFIVRVLLSTGQRNCSPVQVRKLTIVIIPTVCTRPGQVYIVIMREKLRTMFLAYVRQV